MSCSGWLLPRDAMLARRMSICPSVCHKLEFCLCDGRPTYRYISATFWPHSSEGILRRMTFVVAGKDAFSVSVFSDAGPVAYCLSNCETFLLQCDLQLVAAAFLWISAISTASTDIHLITPEHCSGEWYEAGTLSLDGAWLQWRL